MQHGDQFNPYRQFTGSWMPDWLLRRTELSMGAKAVYARLCRYATKTGIAYPSEAKLAEDLGAGLRSVRRWIAELNEQGLVEIERRPNRPNEYRFLWHRWMSGDVEPAQASEEPGEWPHGEANMTGPVRPSWPVGEANMTGPVRPSWPHHPYEESDMKKEREESTLPPARVCALERPATKVGVPESLFRYYGRLAKSEEVAEVLGTLEQHRRAGRDPTPEDLEKAADEGRAWWLENREGNPKSLTPYLNALADVLNPIVKTSSSNGNRPGNHPHARTGQPRGNSGALGAGRPLPPRDWEERARKLRERVFGPE